MSVTFPRGIAAAGVAAGLKSSGAPDVAVVLNTGAPTSRSAAAVFTTNRFAAAPVVWSRAALEICRDAGGTPCAVVLNSGGANACTGEPGASDTALTAATLAGTLGLETARQVLVCSTGLIGAPLRMDALLAGVGQAATNLTIDGGADAARAIMTTDTRPKTAQAEADGYRIGGMAKGAGMLAPALATMLVVLTTDALLTSADAQTALETACAATFDRLDSDGCMSTNDTVILLGSGASGVVPDLTAFTTALTAVCHDLGQQLIGDAEGARHDMAITVRGASDETAALAVARAIGRSNLVKTAVFGEDPNWGRILAAAGTVSADVAPFAADGVDVLVNGIRVCHGGAADQDRSLVDLSGRAVDITVDLGAGNAAATLYTNDLTYDYVKENAEYSS